MTLARWEQAVIDDAGNLQTAIYCEVRKEGVAGNPLATLYSDRDGTTPLGNPFLAADGVPAFYAIGGAYKVSLYKAGYSRTLRYQAVGTGAETDADQLLIPGFLFEFETATGSPPADGCVRANNADLSAATRLYVWKSTIAGSSIATRLAALLNKRVLLTSTNAGEQASFQVDVVTDQTTWYEFNVSGHVGATAIPAGRVGLQREGSDGATGASGLFDGTEVVLTGASETLITAHRGKTIICNRATAMALAAQPSATLGTAWAVIVKNIGAGTVTLDPDSAETVDGASTLTLRTGESAIVSSNGTVLRSFALQGYRPSGTDVALADGGTGSSLTAPGSDKPLFFDFSTGFMDFLSLSGLAISGTTMSLDPATQTTQEAASDNTKAVTAAVQQFHPSAAKCWGVTTGGGTPVLQQSYNITSITDAGVGQLGVTIATDFSSANYVFGGMLASSASYYVCGDNRAAGSFTLNQTDDDGSSDDPSSGWMFWAYGDQ